MLKPAMPSINDREGDRLPPGLSRVADAHVHVFPPQIFGAVWQWFDEYAWPIRYQMTTRQIFDFLLARGLRHVVALQYAHKPGIAMQLNQYLAAECRGYRGSVTGLATVYPEEKDAARILRQAFDLGLGGVKLHAHVQCFDMNADYMAPIYDCCQSQRKPLIMHVGREPRSPAYRCDPYQICSAGRLEQVLAVYPDLKVCVPHLGIDEIEAYRHLIRKYDNLWLDTTMALTDYFPISETINIRAYRLERVMYGSDFPNIPYAWDRELKHLSRMGLDLVALEKILWMNAAAFYGFDN